MSKQDIATAAAPWVVEQGLGYGQAKQRALRELGLPPRTPLPDNDAVETAVRDYLAEYCVDSQPAELLALRRLALQWMRRLAAFRPHLGGAVWHGTANRLSDIYLQLFCDDEKTAEIALIDMQVPYEPTTVTGLQNKPVEALSFHVHCPELDEPVGVHLLVNDFDDLRGALVKDSQGRVPRGDLKAVEALLLKNGVD